MHTTFRDLFVGFQKQAWVRDFHHVLRFLDDQQQQQPNSS